MNYFELRQMNREQLIEYIKGLSSSYVPQWHFNEADPDLGTALALIFTDLYTDLIKKSKRMPGKHYVDFLNLMDPSQKASRAAKGHVVFHLSEGTSNSVAVTAGKQLLGTAQSGENLIFETLQSTLLSPAKLTQVFLASSREDAIVNCFNIENQVAMEPITFMPQTFSQNIQAHCLHLRHDRLLNLRTCSAIEVVIEDQQSSLRLEETLSHLASAEKAQWLYAQGGNWMPFAVTREGESLFLRAEDSICLEAPEIRIKLLEPKKISCQSLALRPICEPMNPDVVYHNELELPEQRGHLFGRQFMPYDCFYIGCEEVFTKAGSFIEMKLDYLIEAIPTPYEVPPLNVQWKNVLRKNDLKEPETKKIIISDLALEYWNGLGWSRLETLAFDKNMFGEALHTALKASISFKCPEDMEMTNVGAHSNYWIRLRILRVENNYALLGDYHCPKLSKVLIAYHYPREGVIPQTMMRDQFLAKQVVNPKSQPLTLFYGYGNLSGRALYLCFDRALVGGPTRLLFDVKSQRAEQKPSYKWEMLRLEGGHFKWMDLDVIDDTDSFLKTGLVTMIGHENHAGYTLFSKLGYWIRVVESKTGSLPALIKGIYMNGVAAIQQETMAQAYYSLHKHEYGKVITLPYQNIEALEVWVNEPDLTSQWLAEKGLEYETEYTLEGLVLSQWVKWEETKHFSLHGPEDRCYVANLFEGTIKFGNSVKGALPESQSDQNLKVRIWVNQGEKGNVGPGAVNQLAQSIPNVNQVFNPSAFSGGQTWESRDCALQRASESVHHLNRARSRRDLENLILAADFDIKEVVAIPGRDPWGNLVFGNVTCGMLPKRIAYQQDYFTALKAKVYESLGDQLPCTLVPEQNLFIIEPREITLEVHFVGKLHKLEDYLEAYSGAMQIIEKYMDFDKGNQSGRGWHLGDLPDERYLLGQLQGVSKIAFAERLVINAIELRGYELKEISLKSLINDPFILMRGGKHSIILDV